MFIGFNFSEMRLLCITVFITAWCGLLQAQSVQGYVVEQLPNGTTQPLYNAVVAVKGTTNATYTDSLGHFVLQNVNTATDTLITATMGYVSDTTPIRGNVLLTITLSPLQLTQVEIKGRKDAMQVERVETITSADLTKDACCNLSESFENTATVDVSYSDAVSGAKEIRMLGLDGAYTQMTVENIPAIRGLGNTFG